MKSFYGTCVLNHAKPTTFQTRYNMHIHSHANFAIITPVSWIVHFFFPKFHFHIDYLSGYFSENRNCAFLFSKISFLNWLSKWILQWKLEVHYFLQNHSKCWLTIPQARQWWRRLVIFVNDALHNIHMDVSWSLIQVGALRPRPVSWNYKL